jgi:hypothetical protein
MWSYYFPKTGGPDIGAFLDSERHIYIDWIQRPAQKQKIYHLNLFHLNHQDSRIFTCKQHVPCLAKHNYVAAWCPTKQQVSTRDRSTSKIMRIADGKRPYTEEMQGAHGLAHGKVKTRNREPELFLGANNSRTRNCSSRSSNILRRHHFPC